VHEWHLGLLILVGLTVGAALGVVRDALPVALAGGAALWLVLKDWRDMFPRLRDKSAWRLGLHRPPLPLRTCSRPDDRP